MALVPDKDVRCRRISDLVASGIGVCESCRLVGISEKTFYRWKRAQETRL